MRFAYVLAALTLGARVPAPSSPPIQFHQIQWGDSRKVVLQKLHTAGFAVDDGDHDISFRGRYLGHDGEGMVYMARSGAVRAFFLVQATEGSVIRTYAQLRSALLREYGATRLDMEVYRAPYAKGDGRASEALRQGKLSLGMAWLVGDKPTDGGCFIEVNPDLSIYVVYESPRWHEERRRRGSP